MNKKYDGRTLHRLAALHLIGQLEDINNEVVVADVMRFMNVSKVTAIKKLHTFVEREEIIMTKVPYRANTGKWVIKLHPDMREEYERGLYKSAYMFYCWDVLGVKQNA